MASSVSLDFSQPSENIWGVFFEFLSMCSSWGMVIFFISFFLITVILTRWIKHNERQYLEIKDLWDLIYFFLTKRLMIIPIIYTLGKKQKILSKNQLKEILEIRHRCIDTSLQNDPEARFEQERKISICILDFFTTIQKQKQSTLLGGLKKVIHDLEFIDDKLIELQGKYNRKVSIWNEGYRPLKRRFLRWVFRFSRLRHFQGKI